jgi:hypothetical protein
MKPWFRLYNRVADDPKVQLLTDGLFRIWINVLCIACRHEGILPAPAAMAYTLRCSEDDVIKYISELSAAKLIDFSKDGRVRPHNWDIRQYKSDNSTPRVRDFRQRKKAADEGESGGSEGIDLSDIPF